MLHVPFKGSAPAHTELMGGRIESSSTPSFGDPVRQGGQDEDDRDAGRAPRGRIRLPDAAETVPGFSVAACSASSSRPATPKAVVAKIQADTAKVLAVPETRKRIDDLGMEVVTTRPSSSKR